MRRLIVLTALALGACGGGDKASDDHPMPPDLASNFSQPLDARGTDPDWGLKIRGTALVLSQPNQPDVAGTAPGAVITAHAASWTAALPDGRSMKVSLYASSCADPVSGATYPMSAEVQLPGATPLGGCAGPPAAGRAAVAKR
jgi:uncharacterized membrane protein